MKEIMVSVIMPAYNCERYIRQAIESVLIQSLPFELIIIDDASTDGTKSVVKEFLDDDRVSYIRNEKNIGVAASRNKGMEQAQGKYIAFLDADDCWVEGKLAQQVFLMETKHAVISSTGRQLMREDGTLSDRIIGIKETVSYKELLKSNVLNTSGVMVLAKVALRYPMVEDRLHEDYIMWLSIVKECGIAYGLNEPLLHYRVMEGTKSADKLQSAKMTFGVYRYMGLSLIKSFYYFCFYAWNGFRKHYL